MKVQRKFQGQKSYSAQWLIWKKSWIVPLVLINASWKLIWQFLHVVGGSAIDAKMLTQKFTHLMFAIFCIYQIFVFTRRETKAYFRWKGQTII